MCSRHLGWVSALFVALVAVALGAMPASVHAAAAIKEGEAQTSIGARGADKALSEIQLAFDPVTTAVPSPGDDPATYATTSFELTVTFDPCEVCPTLILPDAGYCFTTAPVINYHKGTITISGTTNEPVCSLPLGDVDIFDIQFTLKPCVCDNTPLFFEIEACNNSDFVTGTDPCTGDTVTATGPDQVTSASMDLSLNQIVAELSAVPLPAAAGSGTAGLVVAMIVLGWTKRRTRSSARAA